MDRQNSKKKTEEQRRNLQKAAVQEILPGYEEYLVLLQERNRLLKKMRKKSTKQIDNERKEQGFSLYVSGANADKDRARQQNNVHQVHEEKAARPVRLKTAGDVPRKKIIDHKDLEMIASEERRRMEERKKLKTAPARERRRNWMAGSVDIKTERGERCKLRPPESVTGNYDDDFEDGSDSDEEKVKLKMSAALDREDSESDIEIDAAKHQKQSPLSPKVKSKTSLSKQQKIPSSDSESEPENEKLLLSLADIKKLRESLAMNKSMRESLAKEVSSDLSDADEEILECIEEISNCEDEESLMPPSPIAEEDDLVPAMDSICLDDRHRQKKTSPFLKPSDTVVLELATPPTKNKVQKNLSVARKKNVDSDEDLSHYRSKPTDRPSSAKDRAKSAITLQSNTPTKSSKRPLSANRVSQKDKIDTDAEASAVLAALRAENEKAAKRSYDINKSQAPQNTSGGKTSMASSNKAVTAPKKSSGSTRSSMASPRNSIEKRPPIKPETKISSNSNVSSSNADVDKSFLSDDRLSDVMKKVMMMQPKQQKRLMKMLGNIEDSTLPESEGDTELIPKTPPSKPVKATVPINKMVNKSNKSPLRPSQEDFDNIEVNIELLSNWGHPELIGLTELQFFDEKRQLIKVKPENVSVHGCKVVTGNLDALFNNKTKTNKERNMWCCYYRPGKPVEMCLSIPSSARGMEINRIKIWNFNKSLTELDIGVKHARIFIGGELIFDGVVEKGCGNQVFDYGFIVYVKDEDKNSPRDDINSSPHSVSPVIHVRSPRVEKTSTKHNVRSPSPSTRPASGSSHSSNESSNVPYNGDKPKVRSETRTMNHNERNLPRPIVLSDRSGSEPEEGHIRGKSVLFYIFVQFY